MKIRPTLSACLLSLLVLAIKVSAAEPTKSRATKPGEYNPQHRTVDAFEAMAAGEIEVRVVPKDVTGGKLLVSNKTGEPLNVKIPDAFATVHVLAQLGGSGVGNQFAGGIGGQAGAGSTGGAGIGNGGGGAGGGGGNFFNVAPEKVGELPYAHVCLEHGKPDPRAAMKYEMRPLETLSTRPEIRELTVMLGNKQVSYRVAQIVAWHVANEMSWEELAAKTVTRLGGGSYPYFSAEEMQTAYRLHEHIVKVLEDSKNVDSLVLPKL